MTPRVIFTYDTKYGEENENEDMLGQGTFWKASECIAIYILVCSFHGPRFDTLCLVLQTTAHQRSVPTGI